MSFDPEPVDSKGFLESSSWHNLLIVVSVISFCLVVSMTSLLLYFVYNSLSETAPLSDNLISNGGFEKNDFGTIENWAQTGIGMNRWYLVADSSDLRGDFSGTRLMERVYFQSLGENRVGYGLRSTDYADCNYFCSVSAVQIIPAEPNKAYTLSGESRIVTGNGGSLYLDFLNSSKARIKPYSQGGFDNIRWSEQSLTATAPADTAYIRVILYSSNSAQGVTYWDDIRLKKG